MKIGHNGDDERDFWDLGGPRPRIYEKAEFSDNSLSVAEVKDEISSASHPTGETIPRRGTHSPAVQRTIHGSRIVTDSYKNRSARGMREKLNLPRTHTVPEGVLCASYESTGPLISKIDVKSRHTDTEFYSKFAANARRIHLEKNSEKVAYFIWKLNQ